MDERTEGWIDGWVGMGFGWVDGWMDEQKGGLMGGYGMVCDLDG